MLLRRPGIEPGQLRRQALQRRTADLIALGDEQTVRHRHLLDRFGTGSQAGGHAEHGIHHRDHSVQAETLGDEEILHEGEENRRRIGQAGRFR
jgi:hypothetical protein